MPGVPKACLGMTTPSARVPVSRTALDSTSKWTTHFNSSVSAGPRTPQTVVLLNPAVKDVTGLLVSWAPSQGAIQYLVVSSAGLNCSSTSTSCTLSPLSCGQVHYITVTAINTAGPSQPSDPLRYISCESFWI